MICDPHWTTYLSALLTPTVAVLGSIIAYRQWRLAQNKLKLDLFDRRFSVYAAARSLLASVMTSGETKDEDIFKFMAATREAKWLLSSEVDKYLEKEIYINALNLARLDAELEDVGVGEVRTKNVKKKAALRKWFMDQYEVLDEHFSPFLKLEH